MSPRRHFQMPTPPGVADFHSAGADAAGMWETHRPDEKLVSTHCAFCGVQCGMHLRVSKGDVIGVEPRMDTHNRGKLCPKGVGAYQQISHPDRLTFPLVRDADGLRRATWDEALDRVIDDIRRIQDAHGKDAVATYGGASTTSIRRVRRRPATGRPTGRTSAGCRHTAASVACSVACTCGWRTRA